MIRPFSAQVIPGTPLIYPITRFWEMITIGVTPGVNGTIEVYYRLTNTTDYKIWNRGSVSVYTEGKLLSPVESLKFVAYTSPAKIEVIL